MPMLNSRQKKLFESRVSYFSGKYGHGYDADDLRSFAYELLYEEYAHGQILDDALIEQSVSRAHGRLYWQSNKQPGALNFDPVSKCDEYVVHDLVDAICSLPEELRKVVNLSIEGDSGNEIATKLGIAESTVSNRKKEIRNRLRSILFRG